MNDKIEWVLVPREADDAMEAAAEDYYEGSGTPFPDWKAAYAAMLAAAPTPEAQAGDAGAIRAFEDYFEASSEDPSMEGELELWLVAWRSALSTPASHDAQQDTSPEYRRGWLAGVESMRQELAQQPAVDDPEGSLRWLDRRIADMGDHDKTTETYQHYVNLRSMIRAQQPAVVGDFDEWYASYDGIGGPKNPEQLARDAWERAAALTSAAAPGYEGHLCGGLGFIPGPEGTGTEFDAQCPDCAATPGEQKGDGDV